MIRDLFCVLCGDEYPANGPARLCNVGVDGHHWRPAGHRVTPYGHTGLYRLAGQPLPEVAESELKGVNCWRRWHDPRNRPAWINHAGEYGR